MHSQVVIINAKLDKGMSASLAARASILALVNYVESHEVRLWLAEGCNIVALRAGSAIELRDIYDDAFRHSMFVSQVLLDRKLAAVGIGPHLNETLKPIIKHLKPL